MTELVAWEGKDFKAARLELFVEALQLYCGVKPHFEATLTINNTLPR